jgi:hypothetical protein
VKGERCHFGRLASAVRGRCFSRPFRAFFQRSLSTRSAWKTSPGAATDATRSTGNKCRFAF